MVRGFNPPECAAHLERCVDDVERWPVQRGRHMVYAEENGLLSRIENFVPLHPALGELVRRGRLFRAVCVLLGERAVLFKDKINFKLPGGGEFKAHQDVQAGWLRYAPRFISAMIAIDPATVENGCLEITSGRHREGLIGDAWAPLSGSQEAAMRFVPAPCQPGDVIFFDGQTPHRSAVNRSRTRRRALYLTWSPRSSGDQRARYFADKRASYPPDIEREPGDSYAFRV